MVKIDTVGRTIYFGAYGQEKGACPYYARVNKARIDGNGQVEVLTPEQATHEAYFSKSDVISWIIIPVRTWNPGACCGITREK